MRTYVDMLELFERVRALQRENEALRAALARAMCGAPYHGRLSCLLERHHMGPHVWLDPMGETMIKW